VNRQVAGKAVNPAAQVDQMTHAPVAHLDPGQLQTAVLEDP
jgi:hypothetical protein